MKFTLNEFEESFQQLSKYITPTPLIKNEWLSSKYGANIYLKLENLQPVGSFKLRGATHKLMKLSQEERAKGVVAVSAGNHAQGVAWAAHKFGIEATIIMPKPSPIIKVMNTRALGAEVLLEGDNVDESFEFVQEYLKENDKTYIHPFCDKDIILGQGSIAMELRDQIDNIDFLFGSIGGGGKLSGVGFVAKELFEDITIIGTQAEGASSMVESLQKGKIVKKDTVSTFADGIKVKRAIPEMYEILDSVIDEAVSISDHKIATGVLELIEQARIITEGAAAINLAAFTELFEKNPRRFKGKDIVLLICGGNIDINLIDRIIDKGLIESSRRLRLNLILPDTPGSLNNLTQKISNADANVLDVRHDRNSPTLGLNESLVELMLETKGVEHSQTIIDYLREDYEIKDL